MKCDQFSELLSMDTSQMAEAPARQMVEHAAQCERCAGLLAEKEAAAEALLSIYHDMVTPEPIRNAIASAQVELVLWAKSVLRKLPKECLQRLDAALPEDLENELAVQDDRTPSKIRAALAVAEAVLAIRTLSTVRRREPSEVLIDREGVVEVVYPRAKRIQASYFAGCIAERAQVSLEDAQHLWSGIVRNLFDGDVGLPGVFASSKRGGGQLSLSAISVIRDDFERTPSNSATEKR